MIPMSINRWIPEGFKGQHLVVVPEIIRRRFERHPLLDGLLVTDAGFLTTDRSPVAINLILSDNDYSFGRR